MIGLVSSTEPMQSSAVVLNGIYDSYQRGRVSNILQVFVNSYRPNAVPPFGVLSETVGGTNPYFATGAGGMLQTVLNGFGGLEITDEGVEQIGGKLPKSWEKLVLKGIGLEEKTFEIK